MRVIFVILIACLCHLQCSEQAKPVKKGNQPHGGGGGGGGMTADDHKEMFNSMSDKCKAFMLNPENKQKLKSMLSSNPDELMKLMMDNDCKSLIDFIAQKSMG